MMLMRLLFAVVFSFSIPAHSQSTKQCAGLFSKRFLLKVIESEREDRSTPDIFSIRDKNDDLVKFDAYLNSDGTLYISVFLSFPERGVRSSFNGPALYKEMFHHFGEGNIQVIKGMWVDGTNYDQFFRGLELGFTDKEAATQTWSGKMAAQYGFTKVKEVDVQRDPWTQRLTVNVSFVRAE